MYAYAKVMIERHKVRTLPVSALMHLGDKTVLQVGEKSFCWIYNDGRAKRIEVETGVSDGEWVEITNHRAAGSKGDEPWTPFDGREQVVLGNLSILVDGGPVQIAPETDTSKASGATTAADRGGQHNERLAIQRVAGGGPVPTGGR